MLDGQNWLKLACELEYLEGPTLFAEFSLAVQSFYCVDST